MKSLLVILTTIGSLFNVFIVEAEKGVNIKSLSGPAVHQSLMLFVNSDNYIRSMPYTSLSKFDEIYSGTKYIFACPAEESKYSSAQTKNSLIVKDIFDIPFCSISLGKILPKTAMKNKEQEFNCGKPVIPSFVHFGEMTGVSGNKYTVNATGFEIYLGESRRVLNDRVDRQFFRLQHNFHWVTVIEILFDPIGLDVRDVIYQMNAYNILPKRTTTMQVQNYTLGKVELFECVRIEELYGIENQRFVFTTLFTNEEDRKIYFDVDQGKFLVQVHLAPLEIFMIPHFMEAARTYGNIAPMWKVVRENAWKKLEHFLHFVVQKVGVLNIISGTYDTLTLPSSGKLFLGNNQVRVPLAFYKIVVHQQTINETQSILIVTTNNPFENIPGVLCEENQCAKYGWNEIENNDYTKGFTSCCPLTENILDLLDIKFLKPIDYANVFSLEGISFSDLRPQHSESVVEPKLNSAEKRNRDRIKCINETKQKQRSLKYDSSHGLPTLSRGL